MEMLKMQLTTKRTQNRQNLLNIKIPNNPNKTLHIIWKDMFKNRLPNKQLKHETIHILITLTTCSNCPTTIIINNISILT